MCRFKKSSIKIKIYHKVVFFALLSLWEAKVNTPVDPTHAQTQSSCLSNVRMKHSRSSGVKDKHTSLCWTASVSCSLTNILCVFLCEVMDFHNVSHMNHFSYSSSFCSCDTYTHITNRVMSPYSIDGIQAYVSITLNVFICVLT